MPRSRVLFVGCHLPYPPLSGGRRRELELIKRLSERFEVHLLVVSKTAEQDLRNAHELGPFCERVEVFPAEPPGPHADGPRQLLRHRCPALTRRVAELLGSEPFDLVHVEGFYLLQHVPADAGLPVLLVEQNIEYDLERQRAVTVGEPDHAVHDMRTLRAELDAWRRADLLGVLTPEDREMLLGALPGARVRLVPDGADHLSQTAAGDESAERPDAPLLLFLANFGYAPNVDAAAHLCEDILPLIRERVPDVRLWLVGTDPPPAVRALADDRIRVTGRVPAVVPYIDAADVMVCPLRIGGGIKVKAIEALRRGKCIVSSSVGGQGLPPEARSAVAIADDPADVAATVAALLADRRLRERMERAAGAAGAALPTWDAAADALADAYGELLTRRAPVAVSA